MAWGRWAPAPSALCGTDFERRRETSGSAHPGLRPGGDRRLAAQGRSAARAGQRAGTPPASESGSEGSRMRTQREQARLQGDAATERGREPGTIPALRCGRRAVPDPAAVPAALSSSRAARARPAVLRPGSVPLAPGPVPPGAPSSQVPCRPPAPRRRRPTTRPGRASPSRPAAHSGGRRAHRARRRGVRGRATDAGTARRPAASPAAAARVGIAPRPLGLRV